MHNNNLGTQWWTWIAPLFWQVAILAVVVAGLELALRKRGWPRVRVGFLILFLDKVISRYGTVTITLNAEKIPPPVARSPVVRLKSTVLFKTVTWPLAWTPPPCALAPAVLLPLTVLSVSVTRPRE